MKGILGRKAGMTQVFNKNGHLIPVTVIETKGNIVTQIKTVTSDGYDSTQLSYGEQKENKIIKAKKGHFKKAKSTPKRFTREIRNMTGFELGVEIKPSQIFAKGELVDVSGTSKGKGFAGVIKRHNAQRGPMSHGSQFHRQIGSMSDVEGNKIQKGKIMPGQMGSVKRTTQNLAIIDINDEEGYILIKGSVPGANKSFVTIKSAIKGLASKEVADLIDYEAEAKAQAQAKIEAEAKAKAEAQEAAKAEAEVAMETSKQEDKEAAKE